MARWRDDQPARLDLGGEWEFFAFFAKNENHGSLIQAGVGQAGLHLQDNRQLLSATFWIRSISRNYPPEIWGYHV